jgi:hypothetical protein
MISGGDPHEIRNRVLLRARRILAYPLIRNFGKSPRVTRGRPTARALRRILALLGTNRSTRQNVAYEVGCDRPFIGSTKPSSQSCISACARQERWDATPLQSSANHQGHQVALGRVGDRTREEHLAKRARRARRGGFLDDAARNGH